MSGPPAPPAPRRNSMAQKRSSSSVKKSSAPSSENGSVSNGANAKPSSPSNSVTERTVKKLRLSKALTIPEGTTVSDACRRMAARRVDAVLLTDANALLSGIVTDKDIATRVIAEELRPDQTVISKVMTRNPIFVNADSLAIEALQKMVQGKFRHLPVVENGEVIALLDITKCLYDAISRMEKAAEQGSAIAAAVEAPSALIETLRERMFKPSLSAIISENSRLKVVPGLVMILQIQFCKISGIQHLTWRPRMILTLTGFLTAASKLLCELTCDIGCPKSHSTFLKYLADIGELPLATEHLQCIGDKSPALLHAIQTELAASVSSSLGPDSVPWLSREMAKFSMPSTV
ncbi:UNVERIFIED_CONTAM: CBS domain-containing protein CBSCBSPB3 [Sesamum latifolium]|uniref:CBS domain-containing protein CBSCBSPB3 n=1 Tax=Sesamum latifolium TaxID=2727402 RepID=A0AAW2X9I0_9LAMI